MSADIEGRIEGDGYYALWRRNDRAWGHAIDVTLFDLGGARFGGVSFACHPEFGSKERDIETGLDFFEARYFSSIQGRFTSVDPYNIVIETQYAQDKVAGEKQFLAYLSMPQQWNRYASL